MSSTTLENREQGEVLREKGGRRAARHRPELGRGSHLDKGYTSKGEEATICECAPVRKNVSKSEAM